jgi:hypothetical protein
MWGVTRRFCTHRANTDLTGLVVCVLPAQALSLLHYFESGMISFRERRPVNVFKTVAGSCDDHGTLPGAHKDMRFCLANAGV